MNLTAGTRIGPFEVVDLLGAGGMGEVYRARDTTLGRDVALKVLPESVASDADRLARFEREARLLASLSHPHIAQVHAVEPWRSSRAIVMELVPGPTLADRLAEGPMALTEALSVARQIADALAAAHDQGVIHRDVKPGNVKVNDAGVVKVLDFGLAKALVAEATSVTAQATVTSPAMTALGVILGTAAYMSPEQARGKPVDKRADVWAFGCVLYEMLAGARAFPGDDVHDTAVAVLSKEPDWSKLPPPAPRALRTLLGRCLAKDKAKRLTDLHDAVLEIDDLLTGRDADERPSVKRRPAIVPWAVAAAAGVLAAGLAWQHWRTPDLPELRVDIITPLSADPTMFVLSPEAERLVYVADAEPEHRLWLRNLRAASGVAVPIGGTDGATFPFWSPEGTAVGFFAGGRLKRVDLATGGAVRDLAAAPNPRGGTWSRYAGGTILYALGLREGISRIPSEGGTASRVVELANGQAELRHPRFLGDGGRFAFAAQASGTNERRAPGGLFVGDLAGGPPVRLGDGFTQALPIDGSRLMFMRNSQLVVQALDQAGAGLVGDPTVAVPDVAPGLLNQGAFSFRAGVLAYRRSFASNGTVQWFDRSGSPLGDVGSSGLGQVDLSRDGGRAVVVRDGQVYTLELKTSHERLQSRGASKAIWSADGRSVLVSRADGIWRKAVDTDEPEAHVVSEPSAWPSDVSADSRELIYVTFADGTAHDIWRVPLGGGGEPRPILRSPARESQPQISPDGAWLAYTSNESGQPEILLKRLDENGQAIPVTTSGGVMPRWASDGRELFYLSLAAKMTAVPIAMTGGRIDLGAPRTLFTAPVRLAVLEGTGLSAVYDVAPDGRFLISVDRSERPPITVVLNWKPPAAR